MNTMAKWSHLRVGLEGYLKSFGFLVTIMMIVRLSCGDQHEGFLSVDCGSSDSWYNDSITGLTWENDQKYIQQGWNGEVSVPLHTSVDNSKALNTFRYFPDAVSAPDSSYCYDLPLTKRNISFLIRAMFYHGNSKVLSEALEFDVFVNSSLVLSVIINPDGPLSQRATTPIAWEGMFHSMGTHTYFCLQPSHGTPFISSLELRQLESSSVMDSLEGRNELFLSNIIRWNVGAAPNSPTIRYPDDKYDRLWINGFLSVTMGGNACNHELVKGPLLLNASSDVPSKVLTNGCRWDGLLEVNQNSKAVVTPFSIQPWLSTYDRGFGPKYIYAQFYLNYTSGTNEFGHNNHITLNGAEGRSFTSDYGVLRVIFSIEKMYDIFEVVGDNNFNMILNGSMPNLYALELFEIKVLDTSRTDPTESISFQSLLSALHIKTIQPDPCRPLTSYGVCQLHDELEDKPICISVYDDLFMCEKNPASLRIKEISLPALKPNLQLTSTLLQQIFPIFNKFEYLDTLDLSSSDINQMDFQNFWQNVGYKNGNLQNVNMSYNSITSLLQIYSHSKPNSSTTTIVTSLDISYNNLATNISSLNDYVKRSFLSLLHLYVSSNSVAGELSDATDSNALLSLCTLNMDDNFIQGTIDLSLWYHMWVNIRDGNYLDGPCDHQTQGYSQMFLKFPILSFLHNNISSIKPGLNAFQELFGSLHHNIHWIHQKDVSGVFLGGNPFCEEKSDNFAAVRSYLCRLKVEEYIQYPPASKQVILPAKTFIVVMSVLAFFSITGGLLIAICGGMVIKRSLKQVHALQQIKLEIQTALEEREVHPPFYSYNDLKLATNDFHEDNKLGSGGFGAVYKGVLLDGSTVAVKRLFTDQQQKQVLNEFLNEVVMINGIKHKNLIQLKGCCITENERILVFEYAERGNLAQALKGHETFTTLGWEQRFHICVGIARGLCYLHEELQPRIIHRDIKPPDILLDRQMNAKIADFGLAKSFSEEETHAQYTHVAGTWGYFAPEYATQGQLTEKADVYSFGILLLEIIGGRKCIDSSLPSEQMYLKVWAENLQRDEKLLELVPWELRETVPHDEVLKVIRIALICVQTDPNLRARMSEVVTMLQGSLTALPELLLFRPANQGARFDRASSQSSNVTHTERIEEIDEMPLLREELMDLPSNSSNQADLELTQLTGR